MVGLGLGYGYQVVTAHAVGAAGGSERGFGNPVELFEDPQIAFEGEVLPAAIAAYGRVALGKCNDDVGVFNAGTLLGSFRNMYAEQLASRVLTKIDLQPIERRRRSGKFGMWLGNDCRKRILLHEKYGTVLRSETY